MRGTLTAGGRSEDVLTHFTVWAPPATGADAAAVPPVQKNAVPFAAGELQSSDGEHASRLADRRVQRLGRRRDRAGRARAGVSAPAAPARLVVDVRRSSAARTRRSDDLGGVADIRFLNATPGAHAVTSTDGKTWRDIPQLPTLNLPDGQADGWFRDSDGTVHVLARHLSYYALVGQEVSTKLAMRIITVRRLWLENRAVRRGAHVADRRPRASPASSSRPTARSSRPDDQDSDPACRRDDPARAARRSRSPASTSCRCMRTALGQVVNRTAKIRFLATNARRRRSGRTATLRVAVVHGVRGLDSLGRALGSNFVVTRVSRRGALRRGRHEAPARRPPSSSSTSAPSPRTRSRACTRSCPR